jgi:hypothetical protein
MALESEIDVEQAILQPGRPKVSVPMTENLKIELVDFDRSKSMNPVGEGFIMIGAIVSVSENDVEINKDTLWSMMNVQNMRGNPIWTNLQGTEVDAAFTSFSLNKEDVASSGAVMLFKPKGAPIPEPVELLTLEVSIKPFMNLVWIGTFAIVIGFFVSAFRYKAKLNKLNKSELNSTIHETNGKTPETNGYDNNIAEKEYSINEDK